MGSRPIPASGPDRARSAGILLMVLGALTAAGNGVVLRRVAFGQTVDFGDASLESSPVVIGLTAAGVALGVVAVVAGIGVLRRRATWRVVGITVAVIAALGSLVNLVRIVQINPGAAVLSVLIVAGWILVVVRLVRGDSAFSRAPSGALATIGVIVTVVVVAAAGVVAVPLSPGPPTVTATMRDFAIELDPASGPAGTIRFEITNQGPSAHQFWIYRTELPPGGLPISPETVGRLNEFGDGYMVIAWFFDPIPAGGTKTLDAELDPGTYEIMSNVPSDYLQGMYATFTVS